MEPTLTREQILAMPAAKDLNALVAENLMGYVRMKDRDGDVELVESRLCDYMAKRFESKPSSEPLTICDVPDYSNDTESAFEIVEKLRESKWMVTIQNLSFYGRLSWTVHFRNADLINKEWGVEQPTLPEAIAKCALLTKLKAEVKA